ncbi:MAG: ABC transporter substrate-binding protein [Caldimonas sp.]
MPDRRLFPGASGAGPSALPSTPDRVVGSPANAPSGRHRDRRNLLRFAASACALPAMVLRAQAPARLPHIGVLYIGHQRVDIATVGLEKGLREAGRDPGRTVLLDYRHADGKPDRLAALAAELVQAKVDVIVAGGPGPSIAVRRATDTIPIVTVGGSDPVAEGWAQSLARPGGNVTGLTVTFPEIAAKQLELLRNALPLAVRLAVLHDPDELPVSIIPGLVGPARDLGIELRPLEVRAQGDFATAFRVARDSRTDAILLIETTFIVDNRPLITAFAARERLPVMAEFGALGSDGLLMAYGSDLDDLLRRAAGYVDRILKGARPGDLPIERPAKLELLLNRKVARGLGITFPPSLLLRADRVVE